MKANGISIACCALVAIALGACSGDSQPTGPGAGGTMLRDGYTLYPEATGDATADGGGSTSPTTGGGSTGSSSGTMEPTPYPTYETDPSSGGGGGTGSSGAVVTHPIETFLAAQGTFCMPDGMGGCAAYMRPTANYLGWFDGERGVSAAVDYAGIVNSWFMQNGRWIGTSLRGSVTETPLPDGTARVVVQLNGDNVYAFIDEGAGFDGRTIVGYAPSEPMKPAGAVLGSVDMEVVYIAPSTGAPLPDLVELIAAPKGQRVERFRLLYTGSGMLRDTGERREVRIEYDSNLGPIFPSHPGASGPTAPMGKAIVDFGASGAPA